MAEEKEGKKIVAVAMEVDGSITITPIFEKEKVDAPCLASLDTPTNNHPALDKIREAVVIE
jgi:hypothetical protein